MLFSRSPIRSTSMTAPHSRRHPLLLLLYTAALLVALGCAAVSTASPLAAAEDKHAWIIVQSDDHQLTVRQVAFSTPISGLLALELSGLEVVTQETSFGPVVCSVEGVGCPADDCFCSTAYWSYSYWDDAAWQGYPVGAGSSRITDTGTIEGWRWGEFGASQQPPTAAIAAANALNWLATQADETGSYGSAGANVEAMLAFGANGQAAAAAETTGVLRTQARAYATTSVAAAGKLAVANAVAQSCLPVNAPTVLDYYSPTLGVFSSQSGPQGWAMLGALAAGQPLPAETVDALATQVAETGGWGWMGNGGDDTNATSLAVQALIAAGRSISDSVVADGVTRLKAAQRNDGGFSYGFGADEESDSNSTAYVLQALIAAGENPTGPAWTRNGFTPIDFLLARQQTDGGLEWVADSGSNFLATTQAIPALLGRAYPYAQGFTRCPSVMLPVMTSGAGVE